MTDDSEFNDDDIQAKLRTKLEEFQAYIKKADPFLKKLKSDLASYLSKK